MVGNFAPSWRVRMMNEEEFLEEKRRTLVSKVGLTIELVRGGHGSYRWSIKVSQPNLDENEILERLDRIDKALRRRFLKEEVEKKRKEEVVEEEKPLKTIPLRRKGGKLFGRILIFENKVGIEPLNALPIKDGAVSWLIGLLQGLFKEDVEVERSLSGERIKRIIIHRKLSDQELRQIRRKAAWSFEKAMKREEAERT